MNRFVTPIGPPDSGKHFFFNTLRFKAEGQFGW